LTQKKRDVKPVEEAILSQKSDASGIHCLCETDRQLLLQRTSDLNLNIEKIGELTARSRPTEYVGSTGRQLKSNLGRENSRKHAIVCAGIYNGIAAEISDAIEERHVVNTADSWKLYWGMLRWVEQEQECKVRRRRALGYRIKAEPSTGTPIMEGFFSPFSLACRNASSIVAPLPTSRSWSSEIAAQVPGGSPSNNLGLRTFTSGIRAV
jgi:hypothetical protein